MKNINFFINEKTRFLQVHAGASHYRVNEQDVDEVSLCTIAAGLTDWKIPAMI